MLVLCALINIEVVEELAAERTLGEHTLYGVTDDLIYSVRTLAKVLGSVEALSAGIASITCIDLVSLLLAGEYHLGSVDDDDIVSTVHMGSEGWFVLSANQLGYF